jgi:hypothetical protein
VSGLVQKVQTKLANDLVQHHDFLVRVEISGGDYQPHSIVRIVPRDDPGSGFIVDMRGILFFDRTSTPEVIRSRLERWGHA